MEDDVKPGLGDTPKKDWPKLQRNKELSEHIKPQSESHKRLLEYFLARLRYSERKMADFHNRWRIAELKSQAYVSLLDHEKALKQANQDKGLPPKAVTLIIPLTHAITSTIVTFLLQVFAGRRPIFPVSNNREDQAESAQMVELVLQYNADHSRFVKQLFMFLQDGQTYGLSIFRVLWEEKHRKVTRFSDSGMGQTITRNRELIYQGNRVEVQDPFMFFPDPRVSISDVAEKGEFVFWRNYVGKHLLKKMEAEGEYFHIDAISRDLPRTGYKLLDRHRIAEGDSTPGFDGSNSLSTGFYYQEDQGTCEIIPKELGLGEGEIPEKWQVTICNENQIVQLQPFEHDHDKHPVAISEPYPIGYGFGQPSMADYIGPIQDLVSWFLNARVANVRTTLNNMWIVDPLRVELEDLRKPGEGKIIRLKAPILGQDMRAAIQQLPVLDVTAGHVGDVQHLIRIAQMLSAVNDNTMGIQQEGGRKTATEVRTAIEAGASRLSALARVISAQALVDLREIMCINLQQFQSEEFWINITGQDGISKPLHVKPDMLVGDFNYPVHDGTMPMDRVALLDVWKEIFAITGQDPQLVGRYDRGKIFEYMAELGGARNIEAMRIVADPAMMQAQAQGQLQPVGPMALPMAQSMGPSNKINALGGPKPASRAVNGAQQ